MYQINAKNKNPTKPMNKMSATPMPVPASQASRLSSVVSFAHSLAAAPPIAQTKMSAHQMIKTQVILRQCGRGNPLRPGLAR
ncbi:MAG: hypothetical protein ACRDKV_06510 [Solirubrobacterales bacterium]